MLWTYFVAVNMLVTYFVAANMPLTYVAISTTLNLQQHGTCITWVHVERDCDKTAQASCMPCSNVLKIDACCCVLQMCCFTN